MSYLFPFVEGDVFVGVVWDKDIDICSSFDVMNSINDVYVGVFPFCGVLITDKVGHMAVNCMSLYLHRYDAIVSGQYLKGWFHNSNICPLFTVSSVGKKSTFPLNIAVLFWVPSIGYCKFLTSMPNSISVLGSLSHMMKLCKNLKSAIQSWSVVIPNSVIGDPSAVLRCINVDCIAVLNYYQCSDT